MPVLTCANRRIHLVNIPWNQVPPDTVASAIVGLIIGSIHHRQALWTRLAKRHPRVVPLTAAITSVSDFGATLNVRPRPALGWGGGQGVRVGF